jgi:hypothetical protein
MAISRHNVAVLLMVVALAQPFAALAQIAAANSGEPSIPNHVYTHLACIKVVVYNPIGYLHQYITLAVFSLVMFEPTKIVCNPDQPCGPT